LFDRFDPLYFTLTCVIMVLAIGVHEFCHAKFADLAGDPTPRNQGRVTLNLFNHLDPIGSICFVISNISGIGIGWGRPVMVNPHKMRNPRWDHFISVAAGPLSNLAQAVIFSIVLRIYLKAQGLSAIEVVGVLAHTSQNPLLIFLTMAVLLNISLFCFNLVPIGPLDGHWLVGTFLPEPQRYAWYKFNRGIGMLLFLFLVLIPSGSPADLLGRFYGPLVLKIFFFFAGIHVDL
jgi:Zn-dependent protease